MNGVLSDFIEVLSGVPQGSVLGPILFLIMISNIYQDMLFAINKSFADDTRALHLVENHQDMLNLQRDLNAI